MIHVLLFRISMSGRDVLQSIEQMLPNGPSAPPVGSFPHFSSGLVSNFSNLIKIFF